MKLGRSRNAFASGPLAAPKRTRKRTDAAQVTICQASTLQTDVQNAGERPAMPAPRKVDVSAKLLQLDGNTKVIQTFCPTHLRYEAEYSLKRGTCTNSYLLVDGDSAMLIDVPRVEYMQVFLEVLSKEKSVIDAVVLTHLSPDIVETLAETLRIINKPANGKVELVLSNPALQVLRSKLGDTEEGLQLLASVEVNVPRADGDVDIGRRQLTCVPASTPRYPDMLCVYERNTRRLFSSCLFSAHVNPQRGVMGTDGADRGGWEAYGNDWRHFFDCMFAPVAKQTLQALNKLELVPGAPGGEAPLLAKLSQFLTGQSAADASMLPVRAILPRHGPIVLQSVKQLVGEYARWVDDQIKIGQSAKVAVLYASAYGNTASLAQAICRGITKASVGAELINMETMSLQDCEAVLAESQGFVIGSPTLGGHLPTQVSAMLGSILRSADAKNLPCGVFGSYGWSGESVDVLAGRLKDAGFKAAFNPIKIQFRPDAKALQDENWGALQICEESGTDLAQLVLKKKRRSAKDTSEKSSASAFSLATGAQAAMGRVVGSLSVVTAKDEDAESAFLASWISQASFNPPGLSVAVKKDRAAESLLAMDAPFNVNILAEGREKAVMKAVLKPFAPGEFRFGDLEHERSEGSGCVILKDAASVLECTVADRLDAGDHWVVYGIVRSGRVLDESAVACVHHRKDGTSY